MSQNIPEYAEYGMKSIKEFMPTARITHLTDQSTKQIKGTDRTIRFNPSVHRRKRNVNFLGFEFLSQVDFGEMIFIDPDMMFNTNVEPLMKETFDVAVADRGVTKTVPKYVRKFPFCSLMFIKNKDFWKDCYDVFKKWPDLEWTTNMEVVREVLLSGRYRVKILDGDYYNRCVGSTVLMPKVYDDSVKVFHFRGGRLKYLMKPFWENHVSKHGS
jgi:hypothetical protein